MLDIVGQTALMRPLKFGDPDQIAALKMIEIAIERKEEHENLLQAGIIKRYRVNISFSGETEVYVDAISTQEAEEIAQEEMDIGNADVDIDFISAHKIKPEVTGVKKERKELS